MCRGGLTTICPTACGELIGKVQELQDWGNTPLLGGVCVREKETQFSLHEPTPILILTG